MSFLALVLSIVTGLLIAIPGISKNRPLRSTNVSLRRNRAIHTTTAFDTLDLLWPARHSRHTAGLFLGRRIGFGIVRQCI